MKKISNILLLGFMITSLICALNGCKDEATSTTDLSGTYIISYKTPKSIPTESSLTSLTLTEVSDSRCPINANCVTAGSALVKVKFIDGDSEKVVELCLGVCTTKVTTITSNRIKYAISLTELSPYPDAGFLISSMPQAKIIISKL